MDRQGWIGFYLGILGIAGGTVLGGLMVEHPNWVGWLVNSGIVICVLCIIAAARLLATDKGLRSHFRWVPMWSLRRDDWLPFRTLIPMDKALQKAFDKLQGGVTEMAARRLADNPFDYMYHALKLHRLWGAKSPSTQLVRIPPEVLANAIYDKQTNRLREAGASEFNYTDIQMLRSDLSSAVKGLKARDKKFVASGI